MLRLQELRASLKMEQACGHARDRNDHPPPGTLLPGDLTKPAENPPPADPKTDTPPSDPSHAI